MKKKSFKFLSVVMTLVMILSSAAVVSTAAKDEKEIVYQNGTFTKYKDGDYYRYVGATGYQKEDFSDAAAVISTAQDYYKAYGINDKDVAMTGADSLPSSVDLSKSKYFPPVGDQGGLGSCATFSSVYYQFSYAVNENRDVQATAENTRSPQIVYNFISAGFPDGTTHIDNYSFLKKYGAPTLKDVPYTDKDPFNWYAYDGIWREAIRARLKDYYMYDEIGLEDSQITSPDDTDLLAVKTALNDGKVLGYSTYISSWKGTKLKTNPDAPGNNAYAGQEAILVCDGASGGHAMAIVGYDDNIWVDINENDKVDRGEMGAFKIVNSWSNNYANGGFNWVAYDALNKVSVVEGEKSTNRERIFGSIRSITVRDYNDLSDMYIEYTVNTAKRTQHEVYLTGEKDGTIKTYKMFYASGGGYVSVLNEGAFDGNKETASDGVFVCPLDNIASDFTYEDFENYNWSIKFADTKEDGNPLVIKDVKVVNELTGKEYKVTDNIPASVDGSSVSYDIKATTNTNKVVYYIGYDNPTVYYKTEDGEFKQAKMEETNERLGWNSKYIFYDALEDITLYFEGENGEIDDNNGQYYTADSRLNFYRTDDARQKVTITDIRVPKGMEDPGTRFLFETDVSGGYEPLNYQYTIENIETGKISLIPYDQTFEKSHVFYDAGKYNVTVEVTDQAGDTYSFTKFMDIVDLPFEFESFDSNNNKHFVGETSSFTAKTNNEKIISRGPQKSLYKFDVKDAEGNIVYTQTNKSTSMHMGEKKSVIDFEYIPEKAGEYTLTVSSTDDKKEYAEISIAYNVIDKIYGDANTDGLISVIDSTLIQRYCALFVTEDDIRKDLSDCDSDDVVTVMDATLVQRYLAQLEGAQLAGKVIEYIPPVKPTEPETEEPTQKPTEKPTEPPVVKNTVTFTNSFKWSGDIYCYYWSDENKAMTTWPGLRMNNIGVNEYNENMYTFEVPQGATYVIFSNGSVQTTDISYSGGEVRYYPIADTDSKGHNLVKTW